MNAATDPLVLDLEPLPERQQQPAPMPALADNSPAALILTAMGRGAPLAQIEKMMDLQERWENRQAEKAFRESFAAFRGENIVIPKTKHVDRGRGGSFDQAEYDEVCRRLSPALSRHGFGFRHDQRFGHVRVMNEGVESDIGWVWVTCYLEHRLGHTEKLELEGPPGELSVNTPTQNMQATASYLKRQSLLAITGTATGGEDDESRLRNRADGAGAEASEQRALEKKPFPASNFTASLPAFQKAINKGKTPADVLATFEQFNPEFALTEAQRAEILALKPAADAAANSKPAQTTA